MIGSPLIIAEKARNRLQAVMASMRQGAIETSQVDIIHLPDPADIVISPCEVNRSHGTGTLLLRIFSDWSSIVSLRTNNFYDDDQSFGAAKLCLPLASSSRPEISSWLRWYISGTTARRIIVFPYTPAEVTMALTAHEMLGVPLCTYVMDDKNVCVDGITDELMQELFAKSRLRLVISPEMREAYEKKYRMRFWVMPPVVANEIIRTTPVPTPEAKPGSAVRGILLGNIWGQRWLDALREKLPDSGSSVDWYCNQKTPSGLLYRRDELERDGIRQLDPIAEADLPAVLARYPFTLVPSDPLDGKSPAPVRAIAELSLPSRMVTLMATAHLPMLVVGSPDTCAARFVERFDLGAVVPYDSAAIKDAVARLMAPATQNAIRSRAATLAPYFTARGAADWIWRSLDLGQAATFVYEELMPKRHLADGERRK